MKTPLLSLILLLLGASGVAQEITGPEKTSPGSLATFEISPPQEAAWCLIPNEPPGCFQVDASSRKLYFASPNEREYTIVAAMILDGKPVLLSKTLTNGSEEIKPSPVPGPSPGPTPPTPISSLETWIKTNLPQGVKSQNLSRERAIVAGCFEQIVKRIDEGNIKTAQNARTQLQIVLTSSLATASPTAVIDWTAFLAELSRPLEKELGNKINDLSEVKKVLQAIADAMKSIETPKSTTPVKTSVRGIDCPNCRTPGQPNRFFPNILK